MILLGSCAGLGLSAGTLVVTRQPLDGRFRPQLSLHALGDEVVLPAAMNARLSNSLFDSAVRRVGASGCEKGDTLCTETFYVAQGRCDGSFFFLSARSRVERLKSCRRNGIVNIEMESLGLAAFARHVNVPSAALCVVTANCLSDEVVAQDEVALKKFIERGVDVLVGFVQQHLKVGTNWNS